jgi:uncharacterized protein DUF2397
VHSPAIADLITDIAAALTDPVWSACVRSSLSDEAAEDVVAATLRRWQRTWDALGSWFGDADGRPGGFADSYGTSSRGRSPGGSTTPTYLAALGTPDNSTMPLRAAITRHGTPIREERLLDDLIADLRKAAETS